MKNSPPSSTDTRDSAPTTAMHISSPVWLWGSRLLVALTLLAALVAEIIHLPDDIAVHQSRFDDPGSAEAWLYVALMVGGRAVISAVFIITGVVLYLRKPDNRMIVLTAIWFIAFGAQGISFVNAVPDQTLFFGEGLQHLFFLILGSMAWGLAFIFLWLFPDGRIVPRWGIPALAAALFVVFAWTQPPDSPLFPYSWGPLVFSLSHLFIIVAALVGQVWRYRRYSTASQRQQTKWALLGFTIALLSASVFTAILPSMFAETFTKEAISGDLVYLLTDIGFVAIPIAMVFALMRYRLWEADLAINRSLVYGLVAGILALIFFAILLGLQVIVGQTQPTIAFVISAVVAALVFRPLRGRVQHFVDRYIYRFRFDLDELRDAQKERPITSPGALTGRRLGPYEVLDLVGRGGMGEVYRATGEGRTVAVKTLLLDKSQDAELLQRFQREAQTGMGLDHPNIARVHSIERQDGLIYMVMDYLEGQDLSKLLKEQGALDPETVIEIAQGLAGALDAAHAGGLVHRDIKPSNVMLALREDGETYRPILMDFGITKIKGANTLTGTGAIGTIDYMAPEQILNAKAVDHRADIYSLGIVLYEAVTGQRPFKGEVGQVLFAHIQQPAPDPRDLRPETPRPLAKVIMKALEKDPDKRFQSGQELAAALL